MSNQQCGDCRFWGPDNGDPTIGQGNCVRYPETQRKWSDQWCGEWKPIEKEFNPMKYIHIFEDDGSGHGCR